MKNVELFTYNVGHGVFNLVMGEDGISGNSFCRIFDCGTIMENPIYSKDSPNSKNPIIKDAVEKIKRKVNCIDLIVISHQDYDHWSMLEDFIKEFYGIEAIEKNVFCRKNKIYGEIDGDSVRHISENNFNYLYTAYIEDEHNFSVDIQMKFTPADIVTDFDVVQKLYNADTYTIQNTISISVKMLTDKLSAVHKRCLVFNYDKKPELSRISGLGAAVNVKELSTNIKEQLEELSRDWRCDNDKLQKIIIKELNECQRMKEKFINMEKENINNHVCQIDTVILGGLCRGKLYRQLYYKLQMFQYANLISSIEREAESYREYEDGFFKNICLRTKFCTGDLWTKENPDSKKDDVRRNASSVVVNCRFNLPPSMIDHIFMIFPGDLTQHMFGKLANVLNSGQNSTKLIILIAPHHGSGKTNFQLPPAAARFEDDENQPLRKLLEKLTKDKNIPMRIYISTIKAKYGHPMKEFVKLAEKYAEESDPGREHSIYCGSKYDYDKNEFVRTTDKEYEYKTEKEVYCTEAPLFIPGAAAAIVPMYLYYQWPSAPALTAASDTAAGQPLTAVNAMPLTTTEKRKPRIPSKKLFI